MGEKILHGRLIVIAGPSGVGKGTVVRRVLQEEKTCRASISATTRPPRAGERPGREYFFLTADEFAAKVSGGEMLEYEEYNGNYYGTPREYVESNLERGLDVILEIDVKGAMAVKRRYPAAFLIFLLPPSFEELKRRLKSRGTERQEEIEQRVKLAAWEVKQANSFDEVLTNEDIEKTVKRVREAIKRHDEV